MAISIRLDKPRKSQTPWVLCNIRYASETHKLILNQILAKSRLPITYWSIIQSFCNFAQSTTVIPLYSAQKSKAIGQLKLMLWTDEISRGLRLRWVSDGYPISHSNPDMKISLSNSISIWIEQGKDGASPCLKQIVEPCKISTVCIAMFHSENGLSKKNTYYGTSSCICGNAHFLVNIVIW